MFKIFTKENRLIYELPGGEKPLPAVESADDISEQEEKVRKETTGELNEFSKLMSVSMIEKVQNGILKPSELTNAGEFFEVLKNNNNKPEPQEILRKWLEEKKIPFDREWMKLSDRLAEFGDKQDPVKVLEKWMMEKEYDEYDQKFQGLASKLEKESKKPENLVLDQWLETKQGLNKEDFLREVSELIKEYEADYEDLESWKDHYIEQFGKELGEKVYDLMGKMMKNEFLSEDNYQTIAVLNLQEGDILKITETASGEQNLKSIFSMVLFDTLLSKLDQNQRNRVLNILIKNLIDKNKNNAEKVSREILSMFSRNLITEEELKNIIVQNKESNPALSQILEKKLQENKPRELREIYFEKLQKQIEKGKPGPVNIQILKGKTPYVSPEKADANWAASVTNLKNIFLFEVVGRILMVGVALNTLGPIIGATIGKKGQRWNQLQKMITNPYLYGNLAGLAAIYDSTLGAGYTEKALGAGPVGELLKISPQYKQARQLSAWTKENSKDEDLKSLDWSTINTLQINSNLYNDIQKFNCLDKEDYDTLIKNIKEMKPPKTLSNILAEGVHSKTYGHIKFNISPDYLKSIYPPLNNSSEIGVHFVNYLLTIAKTCADSSHVIFKSRIAPHTKEVMQSQFSVKKSFSVDSFGDHPQWKKEEKEE
ncbi:MAG: hypothetical protein UR27_C0016G0005 [Candidatus Peregrinibacteria bacterium GW2011_GWA2_33_10]|nr:MAG: hypothetical protein UR27_C0016G0005 [Candidatus Peregrinibacteria bacterium GW2011_GWA2_33_10]KKP38489.1 MAG: hypothetical protein UR30_C0018G0016 [Candidatus Peregrinibacteria bacterium GW2011_GWC2_33_13]OGJ50029.1 MAG: hypothetical protein A2229_04280 [Candidatus Peregrinibacteria bacterium RIFOXYA2_FULL_33_7]